MFLPKVWEATRKAQERKIAIKILKKNIKATIILHVRN